MPKITLDLTQEQYNGLRILAERVWNQDNFGTADPVYIIYDKKQVSAADGNKDGTEWLSDDHNGYSEEEMRDLIVEQELATKEDAAKMLDYELADQLGFTEFNYQEIDVFQELFFTREAAEIVLKCQSHHFRKPHIWVGSAHNNHEIRLIRSILLSMMEPKLV